MPPAAHARLSSEAVLTIARQHLPLDVKMARRGENSPERQPVVTKACHQFYEKLCEVTGKFPSDPNAAITVIRDCIPDMSDRPNVRENVMRRIRKIQQKILQLLAAPALRRIAKEMNRDGYLANCTRAFGAVRKY